jgi:GNAT superfamily N-acetyltransferase
MDKSAQQKSPAGGLAIRSLEPGESMSILEVINDAASAYQGVIPADRVHEPYMAPEELAREQQDGVQFWGVLEGGALLGVMGSQDVREVSLIRHAYVRTAHRGKGLGGALAAELKKMARRPLLVGTWAAADWAVRFYEKQGFTLVTPEEKDRLLRLYWNIPDRQIETSVVLADQAWFSSPWRR